MEASVKETSLFFQKRFFFFAYFSVQNATEPSSAPPTIYRSFVLILVTKFKLVMYPFKGLSETLKGLGGAVLH